jgi:thymidine kinase
MAKLYFRYGAMNCGKTTLLLQVAHNYEERDMKVLILKPSIDTKGEENIVSRIGVKRKVDHLINKDENLGDYLNSVSKEIVCLLIDEAQFLTKDQVDELFMFSKQKDIPVICYGLRSDFKTIAFPGSLRLFELCDEMDELYTICRCGKKAKFNGRKINGKFTIEGSQVAIDGEDNIEYESLCGKCYIEKVLGMNEDKVAK